MAQYGDTTRGMMEEYIQSQLDRPVDGDVHRFGELRDFVPCLADGIRDAIAKQNSREYLTPRHSTAGI